MLSRDEKEKRVIELRNQDKPLREIAKEVHMSFGPISRIINKHMGEESYANEPKRKERREEKLVLSKTVQAFKLFEQGKKQVEVAIKLDLGAEELTKIYKGYRDLKGSDDLNQVLEELRGEIPSFVKFYYDTKNAGISPQRVVIALNTVEQLPTIETQFQTLKNDVFLLETYKERMEHDLCDLGNQVAAARDTLHSSNKYIEIINGELSKLNYNKHQLENFIASLKSDTEQYKSFRNDVEKQMRQTLSDKKIILLIAVTSVLEVLREDPNKQWLIYDGLDDPPCTLPPVPLELNSQQYRQLCLTILVELAEEVFNKLLNRSVDILISSVVERPKTVSDTQM